MLPKRIKQQRKRNGFTQKMLAEELNTTQRRVSYWESGQALPNSDEIVELCKLFEVSADYLLGISRSMN